MSASDARPVIRSTAEAGRDDAPTDAIADSQADAENAGALPGRPRSSLIRWLRRITFALALIVLVALVGLWVATRSWFLIWRLEPALSNKLGGDVNIAHAHYDGGGRVIFRDITLTARSLEGPAAEIARIGHALVNVELGRLLGGELRIQDVELDDVTVRISEDMREHGEMNFRALEPKRRSTGKPLPPPPRMQMRNLALEVGMHDGAVFVLNGRRLMAGEIEPIPGQDDWFAFDLREVDERGRGLAEGGLLIKGEWNAHTTESHSLIQGIALDDRIHRMLPRQAHSAWMQMDLQGQVNDVRIDWQPDAPLTVQFSLKDVAMTLPVDLGEMWALYRNGAVEETASRPRMKVQSGNIRVGADSLALDGIAGELISSGESGPVIPVPYIINLSVPSLPKIDLADPERWLEDALKTAAFEASLTMEDFSLRSDEAQTHAVGLPTLVARTLAKFQMTGWVLSTSAHVSRGEPVTDEHGELKPAPLRMTGQAYINRATGRYHKFPYLMEDVYAYLHFNNERVKVEYLNARGSGDAVFHIRGVIEPPDRHASFDMQVTGLNVPLDDRLREALRPGELQAFDALFSRGSAESMARAGLLPNRALLDRQAQRRSEAAAELALIRRAGVDEPAAIARLEQQIALLERSIAVGPFAAGGAVDVQLSVQRDVGPSQPANVGGTISLRSVGLIFDRFPYPLRANAGRLNWTDDRVTIDPGPSGAGLRFVTPAGGVGYVSGEVDFAKVDGERKIAPDLAFVIEDDPANPAVYAAIPFSDSEAQENPALLRDWPGLERSRAGRMVEGIGLQGAFDYQGRIFTRDDGKMTWDFGVALDGGAAAPTALLARELNARDRLWPDGFTLRDISGSVNVGRDAVSWNNVAGTAADDTAVTTTGLIGFGDDGDADTVTVLAENAPIDRSALNMISEAGAPRADELWDRYQPQGRYDVTVAYRSDAPPDQLAVVTMQPREMSLMLEAERVLLHRLDGSAAIDRREVRFDDLQFGMGRAGAPDSGNFGVRGVWRFGDEIPSYEIAGEWSRGRLESPLIPAVLRLGEADAEREQYAQWDPAGDMDLTYRIARAAPDAPLDYRFHIAPHNVEFTLSGLRLSLQLDQGETIITPGLIALENLRGETGSGRFALAGTIATTAPMESRLAIDYQGLLRSDELAAFLPETVNLSLEALEFHDTTASRVDGGMLHVRRTAGEDGGGWQTHFTGRIETRGASFLAGLQFSEVDGWIDLDVAHETGRPPRFEALARASRAVVLGQALTDIEAPISFNEEGDQVLLPAAQARTGDGAVAATATVGMGTILDYEVRVDVSGMPLGNLLAGRSGALDDQAVANAPTTAAPPQRPVSGRVYTSLSLSGLRGDPDSKRGRGLFRILDGNITSIPLLLQAMQVMQLTFPFSGRLDYADADIYILGNIAHFERILFESTVGNSAALQLIGEGSLDLITMEITARFRPRSGIVLLRDIIGGIGDMLYEIEVTGPLGSPQARIVPLP